MTRLLLWLFAALLPLSAASDPAAPHPRPPSIRTMFGHLSAGNLPVIHGIRLGASDGNGPIDSVIVVDSVGAAIQTATVAAQPPIVVTFLWPVTAGQTITGKVCARAKRRNAVSVSTCLAWSKSVPDVPPPPVVIDSVNQVKSLMVVPKPPSLVVRPITLPCACVFFRFKNLAIAEAAKDQAQCDGVYQTNVGAFHRQTVSAAQQAIADTATVGWSTVWTSWTDPGPPPAATVTFCGASNAGAVSVQ